VDNERFTYNNGAWIPDETIYWKDQSTAADFYAYYPYSESVNISAHPFSVMADQSTEDNFWASDFLWGKATKVTPTSAAVPIVTNHSLSKILLAIEPGNGFTEESWAAATKSVKICNVKTNATIDLASGVATATGDDGEIVPFLSVPTASGVNPSYKAMIVPQTIADKSKLIVVTVDGTEYVYRAGITFEANTQHRFVVTVNKKGGNVDVNIGEWDDDTTNEGNATVEDEANKQIKYISEKKFEYNWTYESFGANVISHEYTELDGSAINNEGVITCDNDITTIGEEAFASAAPTESWGDGAFQMYLPESVITIGNKAFMNSNVLNVIMGNNITSIGDYAFYNSALFRLALPNSLKTIGSSAFRRCMQLTELTLPESITYIGDYAFMSSILNTLNCKATTPPSIGIEVFSGSNVYAIYVPDEAVDAYKNAEGWSAYADRIFAASEME
jgi:hypothetical protein